MKPAARFLILAGLAWLLGLDLAILVCQALAPWASRRGGSCRPCWSTLLQQAAWRAQARLSDAQPWAWEGRDMQLTRPVDSQPEHTWGQSGAQGWRFDFALEAPSEGGWHVRRLARPLLLTDGDVLAARALPAPRGRVRLKRTQGAVNLEGFAYEPWRLDQSLQAPGSACPAGRLWLDAAPWSPPIISARGYAKRWRQTRPNHTASARWQASLWTTRPPLGFGKWVAREPISPLPL